MNRILLFLLLTISTFGFTQEFRWISTEHAEGAQALIENQLMQIDGVHGVGVGLAADGVTPVIKVFVDSKKNVDTISIPQSSDGVDIEIIYTEPFESQINMGDGVSPGGLVGTLGFRANRIYATSEKGYVTNNHIASADSSNSCPSFVNPENFTAAFGTFNQSLCNVGGVGGESCIGPAGNLAQVVPFVAGERFPNVVDAAFVVGNNTSSTVSGIGTVTNENTVNPRLGMWVIKSGRTSGVTKGVIVAVNVTAMVSYNIRIDCGFIKFVNQVIVEPSSPYANFSRPGDSGSSVFVDTEDPQLTGLLFAGSSSPSFSVINPIQSVLGSLSVEPDFGTSPKNFWGVYNVTDSSGRPKGYVSLSQNPVLENDVIMYWLITTDVKGFSRTFAGQTHYTTDAWKWNASTQEWSTKMSTYMNGLASNEGIYQFEYSARNKSFTLTTIRCLSPYCPVGSYISGKLRTW